MKSRRPMMVSTQPLSPEPGVVLDWQSVTSGTSRTFHGGETYYVSGTASFTGTVAFDGGTVVK